MRKCQKPRGRAALALVVKVGSVVETEEERGVAHIVEHLAFNATEVSAGVQRLSLEFEYFLSFYCGITYV